jgi:hypothetical protein
MKRFLAPLSLVTVSMLLSYVLLELTYRVWIYETIKSQLITIALTQFPRNEGGTSRSTIRLPAIVTART